MKLLQSDNKCQFLTTLEMRHFGQSELKNAVWSFLSKRQQGSAGIN